MIGIISGVAAIILALIYIVWISVGILALPFVDYPPLNVAFLVYAPGLALAALGAALIKWR